MNNDSQKPVALVTGSSKGIGKAIAEALAAKGYRVAVTSRTQEQAEDTANAMIDRGYDATGLAFSLETMKDADNLINQVIAQSGRLDILVNNAITQRSALPLQHPVDTDITAAICENIGHTCLLCQKAYPHLKKSRGQVINIASVVTQRHLTGLPLYSIIKGAILQMTKALASEWAQEGIRVNAINPGFIHTQAFYDMGMTEKQVQESYRFYADYQPLGGVEEPAVIGKIAAFLASDDASFMTGNIINADGGYSIKGQPIHG